jgi:hypothetical protein
MNSNYELALVYLLIHDCQHPKIFQLGLPNPFFEIITKICRLSIIGMICRFLIRRIIQHDLLPLEGDET